MLLVHSEKKKKDLLRWRYPWSETYADPADDIHNSNDSGPEEERSEDNMENISRVNEQLPEQKEHISTVEGEEEADTPDFLGLQEMDQYMYLTMPDKEKQIRNQKQMEKNNNQGICGQSITLIGRPAQIWKEQEQDPSWERLR